MLLMIVFLCPAVVCASNSAVPMPYTDEALGKLDSVLETISAPTNVPVDDERTVKVYIATYRKIFAAAGYDYERSIIRIINDIQFDTYRINKTTIKLNGLARELLKLHVESGINPKKYLNKDCAELLVEFRNLIRSNTKKYGGC